MRSVYRVVAVLAGAMALCAPVSAQSGYGFFGNTLEDRGRTDDSGASNFTVIDTAPAFQESGRISRWFWDAQQWATNDIGQQMDLMVWRPLQNNTYQLMFKQSVVSKVWGAQSTAAVGSFWIQQGDVLGYYVPVGCTPVLALDYNASGGGADGYWLGSGGLDVGTTHTFSDVNGTRNYSLGVNTVVPEAGTVVATLAILSPAGLFFRRRSPRKRDMSGNRGRGQL